MKHPLSSKMLLAITKKSPAFQHLGIEGISINKRRGVCELKLKDWHINLAGVIHGGVLFTLLDSTMGFTIYPHLVGSEATLAIEIKINYIKAATLGMKRVKCRASVVSRTRRLAVTEGEIYSLQGKLLAKGIGTFAILNQK